MADVVARSHGGDGGNSPPRGPSRRIGTNCHRSKSKAANPNAKIGKGGKVVRGPTKNTALKARRALDGRPVSIDFRVNQEGFYTHVGPHSSWFSNYVGEVLRDSIPMFCDSWAKVPETAKAHIHEHLHHYFDLDSHIAGPNGDKIVESIEYYLQKRYDDNKYRYKKDNFTAAGGVEKIEEIKRQRPGNKTQEDWDALGRLWMNLLWQLKFRRCIKVIKRARSVQPNCHVHLSSFGLLPLAFI